MLDISVAVRNAEDNLNRTLLEYEDTSSTLAIGFQQLKLQACIFQYDICIEMASLLRNQPKGFAASVALKGIVLRLFEYDLLLSKHLIIRFLALAKAREIEIDREEIRKQRKQWRAELSRLQNWADVRNEAAGHYSKNLVRQIELLKTLNRDEVILVTQAFLQFNMGILNVLRNAGRGSDA